MKQFSLIALAGMCLFIFASFAGPNFKGDKTDNHIHVTHFKNQPLRAQGIISSTQHPGQLSNSSAGSVTGGVCTLSFHSPYFIGTLEIRSGKDWKNAGTTDVLLRATSGKPLNGKVVSLDAKSGSRVSGIYMGKAGNDPVKISFYFEL